MQSIFSAVVIDYDRTIASPDDGFMINPNAAKELEKITALGITKILATGRLLSDLPDERAFSLFDLIVAENGCIVHYCKSNRNKVLAPKNWRTVKKQIERILMESGIRFNSGKYIISIKSFEGIERYLSRLCSGLTLEINADDTMILPKGIDKGFAVKKIIGEKHLSVGIGDNHNDLRLFRAVDVQIAVANAEQILKKGADYVTILPNGEGVAEALSMIRENKLCFSCIPQKRF